MNLPRIPVSVLALCGLAVAGIYLFATRPTALAEETAGKRVPVEHLFRILDAENAAIRKLYTARIVTPGQHAGLEFDEKWKEDGVHAGPLPALVLRETAMRLQTRVSDMSLFLGSDYPIEPINIFRGMQEEKFEQIKADGEPKFFLDPQSGRYTAMFPDPASAEACVTCHNEHPTSPRKDWVLNDMMGATTWSFPRAEVTGEEMLHILAAFRASALDTYQAYLDKTESFPADRKPHIGNDWPSTSSTNIPSMEVFRREVEAMNSSMTLSRLINDFQSLDQPSSPAQDSQGGNP